MLCSLQRPTGRGLCVLAAVCLLPAVPVVPARSTASSPSTAPASARPLGPEQAAERLGEIAAELEPLAAASRKVLLGSRRPDGPSCVQPIKEADLKGRIRRMPGDPDGGPGTRLMAFYAANRQFPSPRNDFLWQQSAMRNLLGRMLAESRAVSPRAEALSRKVRELAAGLRAWNQCPGAAAVARPPESTHWPGTCLRSLRIALAGKDLAASRRWADELASAAFALVDLHRWLEFLLGNYIEALDYQARCQDLYAWTEQVYSAIGRKYSGEGDYDMFPSTALILSVVGNLLEVERQAEQLFQVPKGLRERVVGAGPAAPGAVWLPPDLREDFLLLRSSLSAANRRLWDEAASMPFERSYLANILFRMSSAKMIGPLAVVLRRFDKLHPRAGVAELMDVLFYRGALGSGVVWGDRFDSRLVQAAGHFTGDSRQTLVRAHRLTNTVLGSWRNYKGGIWTLRQALDEQKLDCVRGTDMIGSLYRNAGQAGHGLVHLSCGVASHMTAAAAMTVRGVRVVLIADSLAEKSVRDVWPSAYFYGHTWPKGYPGASGPVFSAEFCLRGLDDYVFAEGYVVRGRHAGELVRAAIPYLPGREQGDTEKVYAGPHPPIPVPRAVATAPSR